MPSGLVDQTGDSGNPLLNTPPSTTSTSRLTLCWHSGHVAVEHLGANTPLKFNYLGELQGDRILFGRRPEDLSVGRLVELTAMRAN